MVFNVTDLEHGISRQLLLNIEVPAQAVLVLEIRVIEADGISQIGIDSQVPAHRLLNSGGKWIAQCGSGGQVAVVGGYERGGGLESRLKAGVDAIIVIKHSRAGADHCLTVKSRRRP